MCSKLGYYNLSRILSKVYIESCIKKTPPKLEGFYRRIFIMILRLDLVEVLFSVLL